MRIFNNIDDIPEEAQNEVIIIGNFDGVHLGHQALINKAKEIAKADHERIGVLTFEPHPRRLFQPDLPPARLTPAGVKQQILEKQHQLDFLFSLDFDWNFASQSADDFVEYILKRGLKAAHVVVGHDFHFGQLRGGTADTIRDAGIPVTVVDPVSNKQGNRISSSRIREKIRQGNIDEANELLGWEWEIQGEIFKGDRRGHELGYPTANVLLKDTIHPAYGIYACLIKIEGEDEWRKAATNIGIRPMFEVKVGQVEAHILDFPDRDLYDKRLHIKPIARLRGEAKFDSLDDLIVQMDKDCALTRDVLS